MSELAKSRELAKDVLAKASKNGTMLGLKQKDVSSLLTDYKSQIQAAIPKHLNADRMIQMAATLIARNPKIAECTVASLIGAVMQASILGFRPVEALGECFFVPYKNKVKMPDGSDRYEMQVQFQIGYKGYLNLARRSGELKTVYAYVVREGDDFRYNLGLNPDLHHVPAENSDSAKITHAYAVSHYKDGGYNFIVLTKREIERYRLRSPSQKATPSGAWDTDYDAMAMKTVIHRLSKYLPTSIDYMEQALVSDGAVIHPESFATDGSGELLNAEYTESEVVTEVEEQVTEEQTKSPARLTEEELREYNQARQNLTLNKED